MKKWVAFVILICAFAIAPAQDFKKIDTWLNSTLEPMGGRAVLVIADKTGKTVYSRSLNLMNMRQQFTAGMIMQGMGIKGGLEDFDPGTRVPIASCSKWLSAALVMRFVDEGALLLSDTVGKFLPVLSQHGKGNITISQCLSHTTGIKAPPLRESLQEMRDIKTMDEAIERIAILPMEGNPGTLFRYSNTGLQVAAAVIEKISGKDFETLFAEKIARPLDMKKTDFGLSRVPLPAGGARGSVEDYMNFLHMILNKGMYKGKRILSEKSVAAMQVNRITKDVKVAYSPAEAGSFGYGFGEWVMQSSSQNDLSKAVSSPGLFGSFPWVDNEKGYSAFLMTFYVNSRGRNERYLDLKQLVDSVLP
jgi:CubicO group peptidase (beta-lactamase class C family)